jgi:predicted SprT family Zn-dependent metalloprotease
MTDKIQQLLKKIKKYGFNWNCDCPTCKVIKKRIEQELKGDKNGK